MACTAQPSTSQQSFAHNAKAANSPANSLWAWGRNQMGIHNRLQLLALACILIAGCSNTHSPSTAKREPCLDVAPEKTMKYENCVADREARKMEALRAFLDDSNVYGTSQTGNVIDDLIVKRTAEGWVRPPSARRGMKVMLQINMLPDGTMTSVTVVKSSGDLPFDNSAVEAVKSVSPLQEMNKLNESDSQQYRSFKMTFTTNNIGS